MKKEQFPIREIKNINNPKDISEINIASLFQYHIKSIAQDIIEQAKSNLNCKEQPI